MHWRPSGECAAPAFFPGRMVRSPALRLKTMDEVIQGLMQALEDWETKCSRCFDESLAGSEESRRRFHEVRQVEAEEICSRTRQASASKHYRRPAKRGSRRRSSLRHLGLVVTMTSRSSPGRSVNRVKGDRLWRRVAISSSSGHNMAPILIRSHFWASVLH
jgi:hypothetical protein